jgi:hypothetical protein
LILSKFAGAAQQLTSTLIVNPNDKFEVAEAIREALQMKQQERVTRWQHMIGALRNRDVSWWAAAFLKALAAQQSDIPPPHSKLKQSHCVKSAPVGAPDDNMPGAPPPGATATWYRLKRRWADAL